MSQENIINREEALQKIKELAEGINYCFFCTDLKQPPFESTPMSVQEVDDQGNIWFLASKESDKYKNINQDKQVQLYFSDPSSIEYLALYGSAEAVDDQQRIDKYWNKFVEGWFEKGREDPNIILFKIVPEKAHYWDTKHHKLVSYAVTLINAIGGDLGDQGREGDILV
ncbi:MULTISPECIES: pyridoxamine 5'-phosphate oxidase family protein [unclassified Sphingobacterium]|uniref:pyridoxamine 5'-phosphate oxidase family protein n=1 Tax=unclassified Sphingobacterium TaxID=2609468 RepID=UPI00104E853D|nr:MULTISPECIES: pyridoxamine 5'-phosphate oxidase family protein [unclassified Sphingobacterium]MCS3552804.1 general stress protein 26 [Sphingobacterium sp. JUb21]TCR10440.1 general stress protein 26 [Sphingobacterium sp. JUb20]